MPRVPGSLRALLTDLIDYAGLYPPASLPLAIVEERYRGFRASPESWMLRRLVLPASRLAEARIAAEWKVALIVEEASGALPPQVECLETKGLDVESSLPVYYEAPVSAIFRGFAKVRTGGLTPDAIPSADQLARFLCEAAQRKLPFKATAGLHHPVRSERALTYAPDSPRAAVHGFLNVFAAATMAWHGMEQARVAALLEERDAAALEFGDDALVWHGCRVAVDQIRAARRDFAHGFGSCSFEEPVSELRELDLLP